MGYIGMCHCEGYGIPPPLSQGIIKKLLDSVFVMFRIIVYKVSVRVISLSRRLRLITPTSTLIILDITKISSNNNCLEIFFRCHELLLGTMGLIILELNCCLTV